MTRDRPIPGAILLLPFLLCPVGAGAQQTEEGEDVCPVGTVDHIFIDNHSIFDTSDPDLDSRFRWAYDLANRLHVRTRESVIRRELLFDVGDCFDPVLLEESERLLRAYPFIARTDIYGIQQPGGGYHVVVDTEDEWSTRAEVRFDLSGQVDVEAIELREQNLAGYGQELGVFYQSREATRSYGIGYRTPQLFRTRWDLSLDAGRTRAGTLFRQELAYPFVGEVGRLAFRQVLNRHDWYFDYIVPRTGSGGFCPDEGPDCRILVPIREKALEVAGLRRFGEPGNLTVVGLGIGFQEISYPGSDSAITFVEGGRYDERQPAPVELRTPVLARMQHLRNVRAMLLLGKRNIEWRKRRGLDSFRGDEDVRLGAEVEVTFARSLPSLESDNDLYGSLELYAATGPPSLFFGTRVRTDARRAYDAPPGEHELQDVTGEGEAFVYIRPTSMARHTLVLRAAGAGAWHVETPFQLTLGGELALRGWPLESFPGGRRVVFTAEDRWYFGWPFPDVADIGASIFTDVGRIWPGDVALGTDSGWRTSVGVGLRANFPAGGTNSFRIDAAFPVGSDGGLGKLQLVIGVGEYLGITAPFTDPQIGRSRMPPISGSLRQIPR